MFFRLFGALALVVVLGSIQASGFTPVCGDSCATGSFCAGSVQNCTSCRGAGGPLSCQPPIGQNSTNATGPIDRCGAPCWGNQFCNKWVSNGNTCLYCQPPPDPHIPNGACVLNPPVRRSLDKKGSYWAKYSKQQLELMQLAYQNLVSGGVVDPNVNTVACQN